MRYPEKSMRYPENISWKGKNFWVCFFSLGEIPGSNRWYRIFSCIESNKVSRSESCLNIMPGNHKNMNPR